jgi:predicted TIM-barrel fold metal-dependent hydrolase
MIIDLHTHMWSGLEQLGRELAGRLRMRRPDRFGQLDAGAAQHERAMSCVNASVVIGFRSERMRAHVPSELIAEFIRRDPQKRVGICGIDPLAQTGHDALDELSRAVDLGLSGVSISPACQGFHPAHSAAMRIYERCAELALPLFVINIEPFTPAAVLEFGRPTLWEEVALAFPTLRILIGGLGHPWIEETLVMLSKHENVFADVAGVASRPWQLYNALLSATSFGVMDKLMFGSGFPFENPAKAIEAIYSVNSYSHGTQMPSVPRSLLRNIVERDSLAALGIEHELSHSQRQPAAAEDELHPELIQVLGRRPATRSGHGS